MASDFEPDERQARVLDALRNRSETLGGIYLTALSAIALPALPGCERARVSVICHCMRELMNRLPGVMSDFAIPRVRPSSDSLKRQLPKLLGQHSDLDLGVDQDLVPVPREVARAFLGLIRAAAGEEGRNRANAAAILTNGADPKHPAIEQWTRAQRFFLEWTHLDLDDERERGLPSDERLLANMRVVEDIVEVRTALFFENLRALDDLLQDANAEEGDGAK